MNDSESSIQELYKIIQLLETHLTQIEYLSNQIGTTNDSDQLRDDLLDWQQRAKKLVSNAQTTYQNLNTIPNSNTTRAQRERVADDLVKLVSRFQNLAQDTLRKQKDNIYDRPTTSLVSNFLFQNNNNNNNGNEDTNSLSVLQVNLDQIQSVRDRDSQLFQMESDINYLNTVMRDMAVLISDQHETIEKIEVKIEKTVPTTVPKPFVYNPVVDPVIQELKEKIALVIALVMFFSIFFLILLAIFI